MAKYGIIFCVYNCADTLDKCLDAWKSIKNDRFVYSAISVPFLEYKDANIPEDNTIELVKESNIMDSHYIEPKFCKETEARNLPLNFLIEKGCDIIFMVDGDEEYTIQDINNILSYIEKYPNTAWFKVGLKNYVFDINHYLEQPFTPARIFRVKSPPFTICQFRDDNNLSYHYNQQLICDEALPNKIIPSYIAWPKHYTWLNGEKSRQKYLYHMKHFGLCSYQVDENGIVSFNQEYFKGKPLPQVITNENTTESS